VVTFGAFVEILDGVEGLVHISELAQHHVENPREIIQPGDPVRVKILEIDSERRRLSLSIKRVEGQVLPVRPILPPSEGEMGDEGVADADLALPPAAAETLAAHAEEPTFAEAAAVNDAAADEAGSVDDADVADAPDSTATAGV
jgi:small subunit ribosomal protein S1